MTNATSPATSRLQRGDTRDGHSVVPSDVFRQVAQGRGNVAPPESLATAPYSRDVAHLRGSFRPRVGPRIVLVALEENVVGVNRPARAGWIFQGRRANRIDIARLREIGEPLGRRVPIGNEQGDVTDVLPRELAGGFTQ